MGIQSDWFSHWEDGYVTNVTLTPLWLDILAQDKSHHTPRALFVNRSQLSSWFNPYIPRNQDTQKQTQKVLNAFTHLEWKVQQGLNFEPSPLRKCPSWSLRWSLDSTVMQLYSLSSPVSKALGLNPAGAEPLCAEFACSLCSRGFPPGAPVPPTIKNILLQCPRPGHWLRPGTAHCLRSILPPCGMGLNAEYHFTYGVHFRHN